jgi:hypothetical protein
MDGTCLPQTVITAKSATARRPAPCALFLFSSPTPGAGEVDDDIELIALLLLAA